MCSKCDELMKKVRALQRGENVKVPVEQVEAFAELLFAELLEKSSEKNLDKGVFTDETP